MANLIKGSTLVNYDDGVVLPLKMPIDNRVVQTCKTAYSTTLESYCCFQYDFNLYTKDWPHWCPVHDVVRFYF